MLCLKYWERGKRPKGALGIEVSDNSLTLARRLDEKYCHEEFSKDEDTYEYKVHGGVIRIVHKQAQERGMHSDVELRGETLSIIERLALETSLPYAPREVEEI
jgi:hypothetical protein